MHPDIKVNWMQDLGVHVQNVKVLHAVVCALPSLATIFDFRLRHSIKNQKRWPAQPVRDSTAFCQQKFADMLPEM